MSNDQHDVVKQAVIETLRYLADSNLTRDPAELADWADMVENQPATYSCCPFCQEVGCDPDCPLRHTREQPDGWTDTDPGMAPGWTDA